MIFVGLQESRSAKARKQEQYKRELQQQMQEQADIKKRYFNYAPLIEEKSPASVLESLTLQKLFLKTHSPKWSSVILSWES